MVDIVPIEQIVSKIYWLRGVKVMLDRDLAALYEVETRILKRNVRRHIKRFPDDFMFELSYQEFASLRSQFGISNRGGTRYKPMAFTEQGLAMLSGILNSDRAIEVNIQIMRAFVRLRHIITDNAELKRELDELRNQTEEQFQVVVLKETDYRVNFTRHFRSVGQRAWQGDPHDFSLQLSSFKTVAPRDPRRAQRCRALERRQRFYLFRQRRRFRHK